MTDDLSARLIALRDQWLKEAKQAAFDGDLCCALTRRNDAEDLDPIIDSLLVIREEPPPQEEVAPPVIASQVYDKERSVVCCSNCRATLFQVKTSQPRPFHFEDEP